MKSFLKQLLSTEPAEPIVIMKQGLVAILISLIPLLGIVSLPIYVCFIYRIYKTMRVRYGGKK
jgi:hypothetical protein